MRSHVFKGEWRQRAHTLFLSIILSLLSICSFHISISFYNSFEILATLFGLLIGAIFLGSHLDSKHPEERTFCGWLILAVAIPLTISGLINCESGTERIVTLSLWVLGIHRFTIKLDASTISRSALLASLVLILLICLRAIGLPLTNLLFNINEASMSLFMLLALGLPQIPSKIFRTAILIFSSGLTLHLGSTGGLIAGLILLGLQFPKTLASKRLIWAFALVVLFSSGTWKLLNQPHSVFWRLELWQLSISKWLNHPIIGEGVCSKFFIQSLAFDLIHAHSSILDLLSHGGIITVTTLGLAILLSFKSIKALPQNSQHVLLLTLLWGLFDDPLVWWAGISILTVSLSQPIAVTSTSKARS